MALDVTHLEKQMELAPRRSLPQLAPEHARALTLLLSPDEQAVAARIESEGAIAELEKRGIPRATVERVREEYATQAFNDRWGLRA